MLCNPNLISKSCRVFSSVRCKLSETNTPITGRSRSRHEGFAAPQPLRCSWILRNGGGEVDAMLRRTASLALPKSHKLPAEFLGVRSDTCAKLTLLVFGDRHVRGFLTLESFVVRLLLSHLPGLHDAPTGTCSHVTRQNDLTTSLPPTPSASPPLH